jgi:hypothetical protein
MHHLDFLLGAAAIVFVMMFTSGCAQNPPGSPRALGDELFTGVPSEGLYRLPYADGTRVIVAAAAGRVVAIRDNFSERQSGRAAADCRNNFAWIAHENGEWTGYSHMAQHSVTGKTKLHFGDTVKAGHY